MKHSVFVVTLTFLASAGLCTPYRPVHERWRSLSSLLQPRQEHSVAVLDDRIYVIGGILSNVSNSGDTPTGSGTISTTNTTEYFDLKSHKWCKAAPVPLRINHGNLATVNGKLYLLGGLSGTNLSSWNGIPNTFAYDPKRDEWSSLAQMPVGTARGASATVASGDNIYLAGGMTQLQLTGEGVQASVTTVTSYNTRTNMWDTNYPPLPGARDHVAGAIINHTFYVTGGRDRGQYNWRNDTWALNLENISAGWTPKAPMITARGGIAYTSVNNHLYTFGGEGNPQNPDTMVFDNVEVYDPATNSWKELIKMKVPRHGMGAAAVGNNIYIPGGGVRISAAPTAYFDVFELF